jgi:hypothetical protein
MIARLARMSRRIFNEAQKAEGKKKKGKFSRSSRKKLDETKRCSVCMCKTLQCVHV